jgi:2-methylisocitrate lyase-like PEP mutase family enzyme
MPRRPTIAEKRRSYRELHETGCFVLPNPWDVGTARYLQHLGYKALASTSSGFAFSLGLPDADWAVPLDLVLAHLRDLVEASDLPVNADFESGYAHPPDGVAENVRRCVETGVAGLSIEDATGDKGQPLYDFELAVARIRAARAAIDAAGGEVVLTGRCETFLVGQPNLDEAIRRLRAYAEAGADCLYAPGLRSREQIATVVAAVAPKPVNFLMAGPLGLTVGDVADLGVRRISVGSSLARAAWGGFIRAAREIAEEGSFDALGQGAPFNDLNGFFRDDLKRRRS